MLSSKIVKNSKAESIILNYKKNRKKVNRKKKLIKIALSRDELSIHFLRVSDLWNCCCWLSRGQFVYLDGSYGNQVLGWGRDRDLDLGPKKRPRRFNRLLSLGISLKSVNTNFKVMCFIGAVFQYQHIKYQHLQSQIIQSHTSHNHIVPVSQKNNNYGYILHFAQKN